VAEFIGSLIFPEERDQWDIDLFKTIQGLATNLETVFTGGIELGVDTNKTISGLVIGGDTNYSEFEADGTLVFNGAATVWDDQQIVLGTVKKGSSAPTDIAYKGCQVLAFNPAQDNKIFFTAQLSHKYKLNSTVEFHIHNTVPDNNAGVIRWIFTYSWADVGDDFPTETTITIDQTMSANSQDEHFLFSIGNLTGSASDVSSILLCSLTREGTHGNDTYANDTYLTAMDFHVEYDTVGSREELSK